MKACFKYFLAVVTLAAGCTQPELEQNLESTSLEDVYLRKVGAGDKRLMLLNTMLLDPEAGLDATILQTSHNFADGLVVRFQPSTGKTEYLKLPTSSGAWGGVVRDGEVYLGGHMEGGFFRMCWDDNKITEMPIPRPNGERFQFVWSVDVGSDGKVYLGTYPEAALLRYDPQTGEIENLGVMSDQPPGENYLRHVNGKFLGKIYCGLGAKAQFVEYDIATGEHQRFLPAKYHNQSFVYYSDRYRDLLVAVTSPEQQMLFFDPATRELLREVALPAGVEDIWLTCYRNFLAIGQYLYFGTAPNDDLYRYDFDNDHHDLIAAGVGRPPGVVQGRYLYCRDAFGRFNVYDVEQEQVVLTRESRFEGAGMWVHALAAGPGNTIVGGTYINQGFFRYDLDSDHITSFGASVSFGGQIDNLIMHRDKLYVAHYTSARLTVYDPAAPWNPGNHSDANPRRIGKVGNWQDRFPAAYHGEDGKLYFGTIPKYGKLGGALTIFDPEIESFEVHRNVVANQSVYALLGDGTGKLYGATSVRGGIGAQPTEKESKLFVWDMTTNQKLKERVIIDNAYEMWSLAWLDDNLLLGSADSLVYIYDCLKDEVVKTRTLATEKIVDLLVSADGWCYGQTENALFRFSKNLQEFETILERPGFWRNCLLETADGRIFTGIGGMLYEVVRRGS